MDDFSMGLQKVFLLMLLVAFFLCLQFLIRFWVVTVVHIEIVCNSGGAFGISLPVWLFILIDSLVVIVMAMVWWKDRNRAFGWPWLLILSGGLGNLLERVLFGCIMDYVRIPFFPMFNIADVALTIGVIGVSFRWYIDDKKKLQ
ncbi:MAG: hypothetical protein CO143_01545 [Candidatus Moranbacteria bacterium CG_4_9_14_3_um_filter_45_14]|nr:MAG: hypothetical protein AUK19_03285 [Candidatus Moranbacteria bacterium CG2_30_45_14]PJA85495.1 MAG: hypothetical protein CO143_01545 [Candidatus Moranbacteria bacterium CG_4_9_14_3_um_filter_45_14]